jgi:hypothetical protein
VQILESVYKRICLFICQEKERKKEREFVIANKRQIIEHGTAVRVKWIDGQSNSPFLQLAISLFHFYFFCELLQLGNIKECSVAHSSYKGFL